MNCDQVAHRLFVPQLGRIAEPANPSRRLGFESAVGLTKVQLPELELSQLVSLGGGPFIPIRRGGERSGFTGLKELVAQHDLGLGITVGGANEHVVGCLSATHRN